jgi:NhaA family Na+:H+ antiporter
MPAVVPRIVHALRGDAVSGCLLIAAAALALAWANSPAADSYESVRAFTFGPSSLHLRLPVQAWAADGLLAVFFFVVGNELKQEFTRGELRSPRRAILPVVAALGGVVVPAGVFALVNAGDSEALSGWGIPMATDIAFAVAVLAVIGRHLPTALRTFLLTLATVDDLCAVVVIAVFYTGSLSWGAFAGAVAGLAVFGYLQNGRGGLAKVVRERVPAWVVYPPLAVVIWALTHASGIHATVAGVAMGLLMRTSALPGEAAAAVPSDRAEHLLRPVSSAVALPLFALMSAGVALSGAGGFLSSTVTIGVLAGLVGGKVLGITGASWLTARLTRAELSPELRWVDIAGVGVLGGVGFTVSLLVAELSYTDTTRLTDAKGAILLASVIASVLACVVLGARNRHYRRLANRSDLR